MSQHGSDDPVEQQLGATLHRLADDAPAAPVDGGRALVERRVRQRAARKRQAMGVGMAAAVVALVGGVVALRPDPSTKLSFGDAPGASAPAGNVTGYATGSITGSPQGWTSTYDTPGGAVDLPKLVADLDATWAPQRMSAVVSDQGAGDSPTPLLVLSDGSSFVVASVQPVTKLGPGRGEPEQIGGHSATVVRRSNGVIQVVVDLDGSTRALVTSGGLDAAALSTVVASLHQQDGAWAMSAPAGSTLVPVATEVPSSYRQRSIEWGRVDPAGTTTTTAPLTDPAAFKRSLGGSSETVVVNVSTGGAYEFYGLLAQRAGWSRLVPASDGSTRIAGVDLVAAAYLDDGGTSASVIGYDAQGTVYQVEHWNMPSETGAMVAPSPITVTLAVAADARWADLVAAATQHQADAAAADEAKVAEYEASLENGTAVDGPVSTTMPAGAASSGPPPAAPAVTTPPTTPPTTAPPVATTTP